MTYSLRALLAVLLASWPYFASAATPDRILEGQAILVWGDPMPGSRQPPELALWIQDVDGRPVLASVDSAVVARAGGTHRVDRQRVRVELEAFETAYGTTSYRALEVHPLSRIPVRAKAVSGTSRWVSLLCKFADVADEPEDRAYFTGMYADAPGRLDHYWQDLSYGAVTVTGSTAAGWFGLPNSHSAYVPNPQSGTDTDLGAIFEDCVAAADPFVDFSRFDGINLMLNELLGCCAWGGGYSTTLDGVTKVWRASWNPPWAFTNAAVIAHEMGHGFGLPHSNNSDGDTVPYDSPWDVMSSSGAYTVIDDTYGHRGKHTISHHKDRLGWIPAAQKLVIDSTCSLVVTIDQLALDSTSNYRMVEIVKSERRSYTVEVREPYGEYDGALPGKAVIIHEVDLDRPEPAWVLDADDPPADFADTEGVMWKPGETFFSAGDRVQIAVLSATANGFEVRIDSGLTGDCPPLATPDTFGTVADHTLNVPAPGVLANDRDLNAGDVVTAEAVSGPAQGSYALAADGSFTYTPNPGFLGDDEIVYRAFDGSAYSNEAPVTIRVLHPEYELETATGNLQYFYVFGPEFAIGVKFELEMAAEVADVGAALYGVEGTVFIALVPLAAGNDLPADPTLGDALFTAVFAPEIGVTQDVVIPVSTTLAKGRYALIVGSGLFGASGTARLAVYDTPSGTAEYLFGNPQVPTFNDWITEDGMRFFIHAIHQAPADCTGDETTGDSDGDGICNDLDACRGDDATGDSDGDRICDDSDVCPNFNDKADVDRDGVPDGCDLCPGFDDKADGDGDGVPDGCDLCSGFDDAADGDGDGVPDGCDLCAGNDATGDPSELCLHDDRFRVGVAWRDFKGNSGTGTPHRLSEESGYFTFFGPGNAEVFVKVLDACRLSGNYWVFDAHLSNVEYTITVTDTQTGQTRTIVNPLGYVAPSVLGTSTLFTECAGGDGSGRPTSEVVNTDDLPPNATPIVEEVEDPAVVGSCREDAHTMCLNNGRFRVHATFRDFQGVPGVAKQWPLTTDSGYSTFFTDSNVELFIKVLDACRLSGNFWVFASGLTNVEIELYVEDTRSGKVWHASNPLGLVFATALDTQTFFTDCP